MFAAKAYDIVMGVDIHIIQPPGPVPPIPIPHPFIGMILDPMDFVPMVGATVYVNNMPRAQAGTAAKDIPPHIPIGGVFVKPPANEGEMFMGSATVNVEGAPFSFMANPVLSCHDIGMPPPPRPKKKGAPKSMFLPTTVVMPIPAGMPVLIGGPPTIDMMAMAMKAGMAAFGKLAKKAKAAKKAKKPKAPKKGKAPASKCNGVGEPVDTANGKVFAIFSDFEIGGIVPLKWERHWYSDSQHDGPIGYGWHHAYDLQVRVADDKIFVRLQDGREAEFDALLPGESFFHREEKILLSFQNGCYSFRSGELLIYNFKRSNRYSDIQVLDSISNFNGHRISFSHDSQDRLVEVRDTANRVLQVENDINGRITRILGPHPDKPGEGFVFITYQYDETGDLIRAADALGHTPQYSYENHLMVKNVTRTGVAFYWEYDGEGPEARCIHTWGDGGLLEYKLKYFPEEEKTIAIDSLGAQKTYFHENGLLVKEIDARGAVWLKEYNEFRDLVSETDPLGLKTIYEYDDFGNQILKVEPDGAAIQIQYNEFGQPVSAVDAMGGSWAWEYDSQGNLTARTDALGNVTKFVWVNGYLTEIINPIEGKTTLGYDPNGNLNMVATPDQQTTWWSYDGLGRSVETIDPKGNRQQRRFDLKGNVIEVAEPDGNTRQLAYDAGGNVIRAKDNHHDVKFEYVGLGKMRARVEAGTRVEFHYDTEERLIAIQNEHGSVYKFDLDTEGNVVAEYGFDGLTRRYVRDMAGKVAEVQRPGGLVTNYEYDLGGRVAKVSHSDGTSEAFQYRADGELVFAKNDAITVGFEKDQLGQILKETQGGFLVESYYDIMGRRISLKSSLGASLDFSRNLMGDVEQVAGQGWITKFRRDNMGLELEREMPGGVRSRWSRDRLGRPLQQQILNGGFSSRTRNYTWDVNDRLRQIIDNQKGPTTFGHDVFGNLAWAQNPDGTTDYRMPDAVGNLFRTKDRNDRKYGPAGQLLQANGTRYEYDAEGNLKCKILPSGKTWQYEWNASGMLSRVVRPDGGIVSFTYDALGRRISKTYNGKTTRWVWDGNVPLHEWVEPGTVPTPTFVEASGGMTVDEAASHSQLVNAADLVTWVFEPDSFSPMAKIAGGQPCSIVTDHLGTPLSMFDQSGKSVWSAELNIYGERTQLAGKAEDCPFRFPGQYEDVETGLYYNRFRYYDAEIGEYISSDPIGLAGGIKLYHYAFDTNVWTDIFGLGKRKWIDLGDGHKGGIDTFNTGGQASFEIHVYNKKGTELGVHGPDGWINKHGHKGDVALPENVKANLDAEVGKMNAKIGHP
ncbi:MAG: RHS domain-containing protein [Lewinellaceae bacterium]|nr:RHS domain-containing protein [Saprospiraceae bacterium]MCB9339202.1 RHS domain-containing protein [Lewinellaceae bacterium]